MKTIRPPMLLLLVALLVGVATTLTVSLARAAQIRHAGPDGRAGLAYGIGEQLGPEFETTWYGLNGPSSDPDSVLMVGDAKPEWGRWYCFVARGAVPPATLHQFADPAGLPAWVPIPADSRSCYEIEAFGWPWPAMWDLKEPIVPWSSGFGPVETPAIRLPDRIAWRGFIGNSSLAALVVLAGWGVLVGIERWRMIMGRCPHCRYDVRGLPTNAPCPECGKPWSDVPMERASGQEPRPSRTTPER